MLLTIDAGNTNVCFAIFKRDQKIASWRASTDIHRTTDEWAVWLLHLMEISGIARDQISAAILSSVVPNVTSGLRALCERYFRGPFYVVGEENVTPGIQALIDRPAEVGADLLVNSLASHSLYGGPLLVIDFGTATTISKVNKDGNFCGVSIAPGIRLSLQALYQGAAKLPDIEIACPEKVIGTNTIESMQSGIFWGYVSMIEGLVRRAQEEDKTAKKLKVIATGGLGSLIHKHTKIIDHHDVDLTLKGLMLIYKQTRTNSKSTYEQKAAS